MRMTEAQSIKQVAIQKWWSQNWGGVVPDLKVHTPQMYQCCCGQHCSKNLMKKIWVVGLPFAVMLGWLAAFSPNTEGEASCCFKRSVTMQKQKATHFFACHTILYGSGSQRVVLRPAAPAYSVIIWELGIHVPHPRPTESETRGGSGIFVF